MFRSKVGIAFMALCVCASLIVTPAAATAATAAGASGASTSVPVKKLKTVAVSGKSKSGKRFTGHYTITHFATKHGKSYAVGNLVGKLGSRHISRSNVAIPVGVQHTGLAGAAAACPILHLVLGPLDLNLLGLTVHLNQVVLDITAQSGPGNLLGNLLCSVAGLLNGPSALGGTLTGLLNILQQLLNVPTLANL